jgi:hypothetical protein
MDHSPSEQLTDDLSQWHTSVLILSEGGEHWQLAADLANRIGSRGSVLRRWSGKRAQSYKPNFASEIMNCLAAYPVSVCAVSAKAKTIKLAIDRMLQDLGLSELLQINPVPGKKIYWEFGPFYRKNASCQGSAVGDPTYFKLPENQAVPVIFICHFVLRAHHQHFQNIRAERQELEWIDWQLMPNKFPNDIDGPMASLFNAIMSGAASQLLVSGNIRVVNFLHSHDDHGSTLADNVAGFLSDKLVREEYSVEIPEKRGAGSSFIWQIWD